MITAFIIFVYLNLTMLAGFIVDEHAPKNGKVTVFEKFVAVVFLPIVTIAVHFLDAIEEGKK